MTRAPVHLAQASYQHCCEAPEFFEAFYTEFFARCPTARPMFAHTDFKRQLGMVKHGLGLLLNFSQHSETEPNILTRLSKRHGRGDLDVHPSLYPYFVDALIATARKFDAQFNDETEAAWRDALAKGIAYMGSKY